MTIFSIKKDIKFDLGSRRLIRRNPEPKMTIFALFLDRLYPLELFNNRNTKIMRKYELEQASQHLQVTTFIKWDKVPKKT